MKPALHVPVTVLSLDGCQVTAHRTVEKDGYVALQLGAGAKKAKNTSRRPSAATSPRLWSSPSAKSPNSASQRTC